MTEDLFSHPKAPPSTENTDPPWMVSFIDTLSLLLTFFVLLFSMSTLDQSTWNEVDEAFDSTFKDATKTGNTGKTINEAVPQILRHSAINLGYLSRILYTQLEKNEIQNNVRISNLDDRLVISLPSDLLFDSASATLKADARTTLVVVGGILRNVRNKMQVNGHTDPNPLRGGGLFASNWELSMARAKTLANTLNKLGLRRHISILGFADAKFSDLHKSIPQYEKFALSRRVDIVIYPYVK